MKKSNQTETLPYLEAPQGVFIPSIGWLRIKSSFFKKQFPELLKAKSIETYYKILDDWAINEVQFPFYLSLISVLFFPSWVFLILFCLIFVLNIFQKNLLYGLGFTKIVQFFGHHWVQILLSIVSITWLGKNAHYVDLSIVVVSIFVVRLGFLAQIPNLLAEKVFKMQFRYEQFLQWICIKESLKDGFPVSKLDEMQKNLKKAIEQSPFSKKKS